ncbi:MAG: hypothetical protein H7A23_26600 [Leptospiraceae bacterium]|nr:hypothetical protein [Leptospiraceae bacterium]MCP5498143.1 hypothetical protein [Leptospiraceae bacterium]
MNNWKILGILLSFIGISLFIGCDKTGAEKTKVMTGFKKMVDYVKSDAYVAMVKEGNEGNKAVFMAKMQDIAKETGYASFEEMDTASKQFADDPEMKKTLEEFMQAVKDAQAKAAATAEPAKDAPAAEEEKEEGGGKDSEE